MGAATNNRRDLLARAVAQAIEPLERRVLFASGDLDALFNGGSVTLDTFGGQDFGNAVAVQSDNKVLVAGHVDTGTSTGNDVAVARFNADGTLDTSFGSGGLVVTNLGSNFDSALALTVQSDGKVVLAGRTLTGTGSDFALVRYNANGSLDSGFGSAGIVRADMGQLNHDTATAVKLTGDGRIVVVGNTTVLGQQQFAVARFTGAGLLDSTFGGGDGITVVEYADGTSVARAVTLLSDGSMIVAGQSMGPFDFGMHFAAVKLGADGTHDATFGTNGWATANLGGEDERANAVVVLGSGRIVLFGESTTGSNQDIGLAAFTSDGQLDESFGGDGTGYVLTDFAGGIDWGAGAQLQSDGKILVVGSAQVNGLSQFAAARYNPDGTLDATFGGGGTVTHGFTGEAFGNAVALNAQGRVYIVGNVVTAAGTFDIAVMRLENTVAAPNVPPTANPGGAYTVTAGQSVVVNGAGSHDVDGSIVSYAWDFNYNGSSFDVDATGTSPTFNAPSNAGGTVRTIALRVIDNNGAVSITTTTITINVVPTVPPPTTPPPSTQKPGTAALVSDPSAPGKKMLSVLGTSGSERIRFQTDRKGNVEVRLGNKKLGTFSGMTRIVVDGGAGHDVLDASDVSIPVALFGGKGNDVMTGGTANDILVGGEGDDVCFGNRGNDVIVGGSGRDQLFSVLGNDVLVGGSLKFENDLTSMNAILSEWTRTDRSLSQRIASLMNGGGKNGAVKLSGNVVDDNVRDYLYGNSNADWLVTGNNDRVQRVR